MGLSSHEIPCQEGHYVCISSRSLFISRSPLILIIMSKRWDDDFKKKCMYVQYGHAITHKNAVLRSLNLQRFYTFSWALLLHNITHNIEEDF